MVSSCTQHLNSWATTCIDLNCFCRSRARNGWQTFYKRFSILQVLHTESTDINIVITLVLQFEGAIFCQRRTIGFKNKPEHGERENILKPCSKAQDSDCGNLDESNSCGLGVRFPTLFPQLPSVPVYFLKTKIGGALSQKVLEREWEGRLGDNQGHAGRQGPTGFAGVAPQRQSSLRRAAAPPSLTR